MESLAELANYQRMFLISIIIAVTLIRLVHSFPVNDLSLPDLAQGAYQYTIEDATQMTQHPKTTDNIAELFKENQPSVSDDRCYEEMECYAEFTRSEELQDRRSSHRQLAKRGQVQGTPTNDLKLRMQQDKVTLRSYIWGYQIYIPPHVIDRIDYRGFRNIREFIDIEEGLVLNLAIYYLSRPTKYIRPYNRDGKGVIIRVLYISPYNPRFSPAGDLY